MLFFGKTPYFPKQKKLNQKGSNDLHILHTFLMIGLEEDGQFSYLLLY